MIHATKNVKVKKSKNTKFKVALWGLKAKIVKKPAFKYNGKTKVPVKIGKDLAGKKVSIKFKGEYFTTKVDLKGNGVLKISKKLARELKLKKGKKYKGRVIYKDMVIYKNTPLNVKIDGKTYTVKTNSKGVAKFKTNKLGVGTHKVIISTSNKNYAVNSKSSIVIKKAKKKTTKKSTTGGYVGSQNSDVFHYSSCASAKRIKSYNKITFSSRSKAIASGYRPCYKCHP